MPSAIGTSDAPIQARRSNNSAGVKLIAYPCVVLYNADGAQYYHVTIGSRKGEIKMAIRPVLPTATRKEIEQLSFSDCGSCHESVVVGTMKTGQARIFEPRPVSGSGDDAVYQRHSCPSREEA
jgi:hypothetical protein